MEEDGDSVENPDFLVGVEEEKSGLVVEVAEDEDAANGLENELNPSVPLETEGHQLQQVLDEHAHQKPPIAAIHPGVLLAC